MKKSYRAATRTPSRLVDRAFTFTSGGAGGVRGIDARTEWVVAKARAGQRLAARSSVHGGCGGARASRAHAPATWRARSNTDATNVPGGTWPATAVVCST